MWPLAAAQLSEAMGGNGTALYDSLPANRNVSIVGEPSRLAVTCLDSPPPASLDEYPTPEILADEIISALKNISPHFGASVSVGEPDGGCQYWPTAGKGPERFTGPWNATLETPLLIVSNTVRGNLAGQICS